MFFQAVESSFVLVKCLIYRERHRGWGLQLQWKDELYKPIKKNLIYSFVQPNDDRQ